MKPVCVLIVGLLFTFRVQAQFTEIPTGTAANIGGITLHEDTLIIVGHPNYFAKYCVTTGDLTILSSPGISGYANFCFQVVQDNYYVFSKQVGAYNHNYILKSSNYGNSWDTLFHTPGLFYTLSMADSTFGVLGGAFGSYAVTDGSDTAWTLDTLGGGAFMSSAIYGDSTAILEGTGYSFYSDDREFSWGTYGQNYFPGPFDAPKQTQFLNKDTIFSISNHNTPTSYFRRLTYNGSSWSSLGTNITPCAMDLVSYTCYSKAHAMQMNPDGTGYVLAYVEGIYYDWQGENINKASIFYTDDYGSNWISYITDIPETMYCMTFLNDTTAFIGGENGLLYQWDLTVPLSNILALDKELEIFQPVRFSPNPVYDIATLKVEEAYLPNTLVIFNQLGQTVYSESISNNTTSISFENLPNGTYYYSVGENRGQFFISK